MTVQDVVYVCAYEALVFSTSWLTRSGQSDLVWLHLRVYIHILYTYIHTHKHMHTHTHTYHNRTCLYHPPLHTQQSWAYFPYRLIQSPFPCRPSLLCE